MRTSIRSAWLMKTGQVSASRITTPRPATYRSFYSSRLSSQSPVPIRRLLSREQSASDNTTLTAPGTSPSSAGPQTPTSSSPTATHPAYEIYFTCKPCTHRSGPHRVTKQGFHKGTTLITCPFCKNRHVVSDHLRIFTDNGGDLVDIMKRHGEKLKKGRLGIRNGELVGNEGDEDIEFWEDGTETPHMTQNSESPQ
jgi:mitochondrial protein import protein ZIM17